MGLPSTDFKSRFNAFQAQVDQFIHDYLCRLEETCSSNQIQTLYDSIKYSLEKGGSRFRPVLAMMTAEALGADSRNVLPFGCAVELIHTYSLIHDDLPCMDDDDTRRGRASNHKVYGEAMAVLAGDALNTEAFHLLSESYASEPSLALTLVSELAWAAGLRGMVGGQALDLNLREAKLTKENLENLHLKKTGALLKVSVMGAARISGATPAEGECLSAFADLLGLVFQISDDIMDGPASEEPTYLKLLDLPALRQYCLNLIADSQEALLPLGDRALGLAAMIRYIYERTSA